VAATVILDRIDTWEAAGLIDGPTAERLRGVERRELPAVAATGDRAGGGGGIGVAEMFTYLGALFVLLAWHATIQAREPIGNPDAVRSIAAFVPGFALGILGIVLARRPAPLRRAAGAALFVSAGEIGAGAFFAMQWFNPSTDYGPQPLDALIGATAGLIAAGFYRWRLAALATQLAVIIGVCSTASLAMNWYDEVIFGSAPFGEGGEVGWGVSFLRVVLTLGWWWLIAALLGFLGLLEERRGGQGSGARAAATRIAAGLAAVLGTWTAITIMGPWNWETEPSRVLEPAVGDALMLAVSIVLVALALRRVTSAYLWPAALGVLIALTDLNASYVVDETGMGPALLVEALALFGIALLSDRIRRRIRRTADERTSGGPGAPAIAAEEPAEGLPEGPAEGPPALV
jgi:hypothetical protein